MLAALDSSRRVVLHDVTDGRELGRPLASRSPFGQVDVAERHGVVTVISGYARRWRLDHAIRETLACSIAGGTFSTETKQRFPLSVDGSR